MNYKLGIIYEPSHIGRDGGVASSNAHSETRRRHRLYEYT